MLAVVMTLLPFVLAGLLAPVVGAAAVHALRNTFLRARLPGLRERLRAWLGPGTEVGEVHLDSRYRLHARGVKVELAGGKLVFRAETAEVGGIPGYLKGQGLDALWLESWEGTFEVPGKQGEPPRLSAPISFRADPSREPDFPVRGKLTARGAVWTHRRAEIGSPPPFDLECVLKLGASGWALEGARASCAGATLEGELVGVFEGEAPPPALDVKAKVASVSAELLAHVLALAETDLLVTLETPELANLPGLRLPKELVLRGEIGLEPDFSRSALLSLETPSTKLALDAKVDPTGALAGSTLTGTLSFADADTCRIFTSDLRPTRDGAMTVDGRLEGTLGHPVLAGRARAPSLELAWASRPELPRFPFTDAAVTIRLERERLAWSELEARGFGGRFFGDGVFHLDTIPVSRETHVGFEGVRVDQIPAGSPDAISLVFSARASGEIRGTGKGPSLEASVAEGVLRFEEPEYRFLRWSTDALSGFGLPAVPTRGTGPCRTRVVIANGKIELADIDGSVSGVRWRGSVASTWAGSLAGSFDVALEPAYLQRSLLLVLPSAFTGTISIPITVSGKLGEPAFQADVIGALSGMLRKDPLGVIEQAATGLGNVVEGVLGGILGIFEDTPPSGRRRPTRSEARWEARREARREAREAKKDAREELDEILDRIIEDGPDATRLKMELMRRGISAQDLDEIIERRKRRRPH